MFLVDRWDFLCFLTFNMKSEQNSLPLCLIRLSKNYNVIKRFFCPLPHQFISRLSKSFHTKGGCEMIFIRNLRLGFGFFFTWKFLFLSRNNRDKFAGIKVVIILVQKTLWPSGWKWVLNETAPFLMLARKKILRTFFKINLENENIKIAKKS